MVGLAFCRSKSSYGVSHGVFSESSLAWQPVVMVKEQKHGKKKHQRDQANEMGAKQRPFGIPGHLCQAAVSSSPLKHVCKDPVMGYETMLKHKAFPIGLESTAILWYSFSFVHVEQLSANGSLCKE